MVLHSQIKQEDVEEVQPVGMGRSTAVRHRTPDLPFADSDNDDDLNFYRREPSDPNVGQKRSLDLLHIGNDEIELGPDHLPEKVTLSGIQNAEQKEYGTRRGEGRVKTERPTSKPAQSSAHHGHATVRKVSTGYSNSAASGNGPAAKKARMDKDAMWKKIQEELDADNEDNDDGEVVVDGPKVGKEDRVVDMYGANGVGSAGHDQQLEVLKPNIAVDQPEILRGRCSVVCKYPI